MSLKDLDGKYKSKIFNMIISIAVVTLFLIAPLFLLGQKKEEVPLNEENVYSERTTDELIDLFYKGNLSASQMQNEVNRYLEHEPDFTVDLADETDDSPGKAVTITKEMSNLLTAYLDGLFIQQNKLDKVTQNMVGELRTLEEIYGEPIRDNLLEVTGYESPLLDGLLGEMRNTPLYINSADNEFKVWVDYDVLGREYNRYFTAFHENLMTLHKDVLRFGYTRDDGEIDVKHIFNRLGVIDEIQNKDQNKDRFYWEKERYQHAVLLTGYGAETKPEWDKERIKQMEEIIATVDEDTDLDHEPYLRIVKELLISFKEEGKYGENTMRIANQWMHDQFIEYREFLEEQQTKEK